VNTGGGGRGGDAPSTSPGAEVQGRTESGGGAVRGVSQTGGDVVPVSPEEQAVAAGASGSALPFTGFAPAGIALLGAAVLLAGVGLRRRA
jgi:hypothetical protein